MGLLQPKVFLLLLLMYFIYENLFFQIVLVAITPIYGLLQQHPDIKLIYKLSMCKQVAKLPNIDKLKTSIIGGIYAANL